MLKTSTLPGGGFTAVSGGWAYVNQRDTIETYDSTGRLLFMSEGGLVTTLTYDAGGRLARAANAFGRGLSLAYDGTGRVSSVTLPDGNVMGYGYDAQNNLVIARFADGTARQYVYENTSFPIALTGVIDESGRRRD